MPSVKKYKHKKIQMSQYTVAFLCTNSTARGGVYSYHADSREASDQGHVPLN